MRILSDAGQNVPPELQQLVGSGGGGKGGKGKGKGKGKVGKGEGGYQKIVSEGHRAMTF